ncbi:MAG: UTP--glucose-1-phosphate uridylyltransferase GalU [Gammaproteobacteria bacterium]|nr:UTP--glucose-1-phosphate uridylyltransferase GalU [Gammaproteobacteria bacterium]NNF61906.1 UTP--glucose-1-phosphate uridylyltransferase GalU [Gammaproteobacteria bacterium]NNM19790.1 UTP--glucose-1-phosphate uridylyltransferase GalU [Gammaproteobacteria bacterium]
MAQKIQTAVFPVAGRGTRFLPATKASPKEMLPIVDKPLIQYAVEEALSAGAERLIFVTGSAKRAIEDHFDSNRELEKELEAAGKHDLLEAVREIAPGRATCIYIRQSAPLGLGHAVLCARKIVGDEYFYVHLADDLIDANVPCLRQMRDVAEKRQGSVIGVQEIPADETDKYGIVKVEEMTDRVGQLNAIVEKPKPAEAPSRLGVVGRYVLSPRTFEMLSQTGRGAGGEIQLTDGIAMLLREEPVFAYEFEGVRYDCGSKLGYLKATVDYALNHDALGSEFADYILEVADQLNQKQRASR